MTAARPLEECRCGDRTGPVGGVCACGGSIPYFTVEAKKWQVEFAQRMFERAATQAAKFDPRAPYSMLVNYFLTLATQSLSDRNIVRLQMLSPGEWHLPYISFTDQQDAWSQNVWSLIALSSSARCANTSYTIPGENRTIDAALAEQINKKLFGGDIKHLSPTEHQACAQAEAKHFANFRGFKQYRSMIPNEAGGDIR